MDPTVVLVLAMVACLAVHSCTFCTSSMPFTTSTHINVMPISMVNTPTVFVFQHWPKALLSVAPLLLNCGLTWLPS